MIEEYINEWCKEYNVDNNITILFEKISDSVLGITYHSYEGSMKKRVSKIYLNEKLLKTPCSKLNIKATSWHEFCHAEVWIKDGHTDGHGKEWNKRLWRKPLLYIWDLFFEQICWLFKK